MLFYLLIDTKTDFQESIQDVFNCDQATLENYAGLYSKGHADHIIINCLVNYQCQGMSYCIHIITDLKSTLDIMICHVSSHHLICFAPSLRSEFPFPEMTFMNHANFCFILLYIKT